MMDNISITVKRRNRTHNKKYNPQLPAPPTKFGTNPRYNPFHPSVLTASDNAPYTAVPNPGLLLVKLLPAAPGLVDVGDVENEEVDWMDGILRGVSASWNRTLTRSRGCMTRVATVPAPRPATAWSWWSANTMGRL